MHVEFTSTTPADIALVVRPVAEGTVPGDLSRAIQEGAKSARFGGRAGQIFESFAEVGERVVRQVLVGTGKDKDGRQHDLERAGAALAAKYLTSGETALVLDVSEAELAAQDVAALLLGLRLRSWRQDSYRTKLKDEQKVTLTRAVVVGAPAEAQAAWNDAAAVADGVEFTRELVSEPANVIYPVSFVERCRERLEGTGAELVALDDAAMQELGMGALLGVGQGSERESRILAIKWLGGDKGQRPTCFVGKGVTFDSGGISIKPGAGMEDMKWDMGGAGAVAGTMLALARRKAQANVIGIMGLAENMPDGKAQRPGDVVTSMSGQTIEVINTDAEGRLVLCDALHWAQQEFDPAAIVDLATLTGAMIVALGDEHAGCFSNDDDLAANLLKAGTATGDKLWRMPIGPAYDKLIDSPIADMKNVGPKGAGSITAAQFLHRFIDKGRPWAHLDIAGMVWADKQGATWDKGATGYGVRLLDRYVRDVLET